MITKQQALEFLYELSQKYEVTINSYIGTLEVKNKDYNFTYDTPAIDKGLEGAVQEFIKLYPEIAEKSSDKIPVDVDMLEVGQTYRLGTGETLYLKDITEYKLIFMHTKNNIIFGIDKEDIKEIYKVNE